MHRKRLEAQVLQSARAHFPNEDFTVLHLSTKVKEDMTKSNPCESRFPSQLEVSKVVKQHKDAFEGVGDKQGEKHSSRLYHMRSESINAGNAL